MGFRGIAGNAQSWLACRSPMDEALKLLRSGLAFADIGFFEKGREAILKALELDPAVFERVCGIGPGASGGGFPACDLDQFAHGPPSGSGLASGGPAQRAGHRLEFTQR